jgi:protein-tyrosine phosphatase
MRQVIQNGGRVYVHCAGGVGRAPTMAAAYLVSTGLATEEAWALIRRKRPFIKPTEAQRAALEQFARESGTAALESTSLAAESFDGPQSAGIPGRVEAAAGARED